MFATTFFRPAHQEEMELSVYRADQSTVDSLGESCMKLSQVERRRSAAQSHLRLQTSLDLNSLRVYQKIFSEGFPCQRDSEGFFSRFIFSWRVEEKKVISFSELCAPKEGPSLFPERMENLRSLDFSTFSHEDILEEDILALIRLYGRDLFVLNLSYCHLLTEEGLVTIAGICRQLTTLHLTGLNGVDKALPLFAEHCPHLTEVYVKGSDFKDSTVNGLEEHGAQWRTLDLSDCAISDKGIIALAEKIPEIRCLKLRGCPDLSNEGMAAIAKGCVKLTAIDLHSCAKIENRSIVPLAQSCLHLESIDLSHCSHLGDEVVIALVNNCSALRSIRLAGCNITSASLDCLAQHRPELTEVDFNFCRRIENAAIKGLALKCQKLTTMHLSACNLEDETVTTIAEHCVKITYLDISHNQNVSGKSIEAVARHCRELRDVRFHNIRAVDQESMRYFAKNRRDLTSITLPSKGNFSNDMESIILSLIKTSPELRLIHFPDFSYGNNTLNALIENCKKIEDVTFHNCVDISNKTFIKFIQQSTTLKTLTLENMGFHEEEMEEIITSLPHLFRLKLVQISWLGSLDVDQVVSKACWKYAVCEYKKYDDSKDFGPLYQQAMVAGGLI